MKTTYRVLLALLCLFAAIACYAMGSQSGLFIFLILGFGLEAMFWLGIFGSKADSTTKKLQ